MDGTRNTGMAGIRMPRGSRGMTLIELMVALAIGTFLMIGAMSVFVESRATFRLNEAVARLQENARYVFDVIEPDIRMANYWGLRSHAYGISGQAAANEPVSPLAAAADCGSNWSVNLGRAVEASNNTYGFACNAYGSPAPTADTLVIRRVATADTAAPAANTLYVRTSRADEASLFAGPGLPAGPIDPESEIHALIVNGFYVSVNSSLDTPGNPVPSLRRKLLRGGAAGPVIADEEILPGVDDLQIQFGVDTDPVGTANYGTVDRYLNPGDPLLDETNPGFDPDARILAVRIWLRLRSERIEVGLPPTAAMSYADQNLPAFADGYRRMLVSKTIYLRNAP